MIKSIKHYFTTHSHKTAFILVSFLLFWPLAIYLLWHHRKLSFKARSAITAVFIAFTVLIGVTAYNEPPTLALTNESISNNYKTDSDSITISGNVSTLHSAQLLVNGKVVSLNPSGHFDYKLSLKEGDTDIKIDARSEKGTDTKEFTVHRTTSAEFAERNSVAKKQIEERELLAKEQASEKKKIAKAEAKQAKTDAIKAMPTCSKTKVDSSCKLKGVIYKTYVYHPAVAIKTHKKTYTSYREKVTGYCTLCNDGTRSPSCATGRGTCSYHGGVAEWNAPIKSKVPVYTKKIIVDEPAKKAYYEKVRDKQYD